MATGTRCTEHDLNPVSPTGKFLFLIHKYWINARIILNSDTIYVKRRSNNTLYNLLRNVVTYLHNAMIKWPFKGVSKMDDVIQQRYDECNYITKSICNV